MKGGVKRRRGEGGGRRRAEDGGGARWERSKRVGGASLHLLVGLHVGGDRWIDRGRDEGRV